MAGSFGRETGYASWLSSQRDKLPRTARLLADVVETGEMFGVRRVEWAAECFCQEGIYPARYQLIQRARVNHIKTWPEVSEAIEAALQALSDVGTG